MHTVCMHEYKLDCSYLTFLLLRKKKREQWEYFLNILLKCKLIKIKKKQLCFGIFLFSKSIQSANKFKKRFDILITPFKITTPT